MLTLISFPGAFGQSSLSPFCVKAEYLLNLSGQAWQREDSNDPRKAPRAKFPVLRTPQGLVHDSDNIRLYLDETGANFDAHLSDVETASARAVQRMMEEHFYFLIVLDRWERDDVWPTIRDTYFSEIPSLLRKPITAALRRTLLKGLRSQGLGRLTWEERMTRADQDLAVLSAHLWETPFLLSDKIGSADASVAAILDTAQSTPIPTLLSERVASDTQLTDYIARVKAVAERK